MLVYSQVDSGIEVGRSQVLEMLCQQDISGAVKRIKEFLLADSKDVTLLNLMANCCYILGEFRDAEQYWNEVLKFEPANKIARSRLKNLKNPAFKFWLKRYYRALTLMQHREYEQAKDILQELLQENDSFISLYKFLGVCCRELGQTEEAIKIWKQGLKLDRNNEELHDFMAEASSESGEPLSPFRMNRGKKRLSRLSLALFSDKPGLVWAFSGIAALVLGVQIMSAVNSYDLSRAERDSKAAVTEKMAGIADTDKRKEVAALSRGVREEEEESAKGKANYYDAHAEMHYYNQGYKAYKKGDLEKAAENFKAVVSMHSQSYINREALYYLARVYYLKGDYDNAERYYWDYIRLFPASNYHDESLYYLASLYYKKGKTDKAREMMKELKELFPESGYITSDLYNKIMQ